MTAESPNKQMRKTHPSNENTHLSMHTLEFEKETINPDKDSEKGELAKEEASDDHGKEEEEQKLSPTLNLNINSMLQNHYDDKN